MPKLYEEAKATTLLWLSIKPARSCAYTNISDTIAFHK